MALKAALRMFKIERKTRGQRVFFMMYNFYLILNGEYSRINSNDYDLK